MKTSKTPLIIASVAALGVAGLLLVRQSVAAASVAPQNIGVSNGQLADCPDSPNCVSSQARDAEHHIAPIAYRGDQDAAHQTLMQVLRAMPRMTIIAEMPDYVYVEFRSFTFGFVDDVEFYFDDEHKLIHVRSASRLGYGDMGVNRRRVEGIADAFYQLR